jgi:hypothetical protein
LTLGPLLNFLRDGFKSFVFLFQLKAGDIVATIFADDDKWYRARVVEVLHDDYDETKTEAFVNQSTNH